MHIDIRKKISASTRERWRDPEYRKRQSVARASRISAKKMFPELAIWRSMVSRCYTPSSSSYDRYGARGIQVCDRWRGVDGFKNFISDMGRRPAGMVGKRAKYQIERIDNDGNYTPENCKWATAKEQVVNRRQSSLCKLKASDIREIRLLWKSLSMRRLAATYKVSHSTIRKILLGQSHRDVADL